MVSPLSRHRHSSSPQTQSKSIDAPSPLHLSSFIPSVLRTNNRNMPSRSCSSATRTRAALPPPLLPSPIISFAHCSVMLPQPPPTGPWLQASPSMLLDRHASAAGRQRGHLSQCLVIHAGPEVYIYRRTGRVEGSTFRPHYIITSQHLI